MDIKTPQCFYNKTGGTRFGLFLIFVLEEKHNELGTVYVLFSTEYLKLKHD